MTKIKTLKNWKLFGNWKLKIENSEYGGAIVMVLVFAGVFVIAVGSLLQFVLQQSMSGRGKVAHEQSLQIAEAGLEYYKWYLAHNPSQDSEVRTVEYKDPVSGQRVGEFTINSVANKQCGDIMNRDIEVTGSADIDDRFTRTVGARYMLPSVANYSYIFNSGVWMGGGSNTIGPLHSNQGIRMDGTHNSLVSSAVSSWNCDSTFGCSPTQTKDGVWGSGSNPELWKYPDDTIDFTQMNVDFTAMKSNAQNNGRYFASVSNGDGDKGYRIVFKSNGTFDVYRVDDTDFNWGWINGWIVSRDYHTIVSETFLGNYTIPSTCSLIFVEDQVWLEGVVSGKVSLVVADLVNDYDPDIILHGSLTKVGGAEDDGITVISENDILFSAKSPEDMIINGVMSTPNGKFGRNHYVESSGQYYASSNGGLTYGWISMDGVGSYQDLGDFSMSGTIVSSVRAVSSWTYQVAKVGGPPPGYFYDMQTSGFTSGSNSYERALSLDPPPFAPSASTIPYYSNWQEQ